jgi:hypothetical protein
LTGVFNPFTSKINEHPDFEDDEEEGEGLSNKKEDSFDRE